MSSHRRGAVALLARSSSGTSTLTAAAAKLFPGWPISIGIVERRNPVARETVERYLDDWYGARLHSVRDQGHRCPCTMNDLSMVSGHSPTQWVLEQSPPDTAQPLGGGPQPRFLCIGRDGAFRRRGDTTKEHGSPKFPRGRPFGAHQESSLATISTGATRKRHWRSPS